MGPLADGIQSALNPHGPHAAEAAAITWVLFAGGAAIFVIVLALAAWALAGRRPGWLSGTGLIVGGGIVFPVVVLSALLVYTLLAAERINAAVTNPQLRVEVIGEQWWWRVRYLDAAGATDFVTANELHLPVGVPVELVLKANDVIHSFWVPPLAGKLDMIPGKTNRLGVVASRAGVFRGQCAEYCGGPHAQMALFVVTHPPAAFEAWRDAQRRPAQREGAGAAAAGERLFLAHCAACHTVRGTGAEGILGPDLTHVGSRRSIGAGILPNNAGAIGGWIAGSQRIKPGNLMPSFGELDGDALAALSGYVAGLE